MQVVMKCFLLNPEKKFLAQIRFVVFEKNAKTVQLRRTPIPKKCLHRAEGYKPIIQVKSQFQALNHLIKMVNESLKLKCNLLAV